MHARYWLALVLLIGTTASPDLAFAEDEEEEEEEEEGGGDGADGGEEDVEEDDDTQDKDQPVLTAGGLFEIGRASCRERVFVGV